MIVHAYIASVPFQLTALDVEIDHSSSSQVHARRPVIQVTTRITTSVNHAFQNVLNALLVLQIAHPAVWDHSSYQTSGFVILPAKATCTMQMLKPINAL